VGLHVVVVVHIAGLLVGACLVGALTYHLPFRGRSVTHFFLSRLLLRFMQVQFDLTQRNPTEPDILTNGGPDCFFAFYCTRRPITTFKTARQLTTQSQEVHSSTSHSTVLRSTLILSSHTSLHTSRDIKCSFPFRSRTKFCINFSSGI